MAILGFTIRQMAHHHRSEDMETTILQMTNHRPMQPFFVQDLGYTIRQMANHQLSELGRS